MDSVSASEADDPGSTPGTRTNLVAQAKARAGFMRYSFQAGFSLCGLMVILAGACHAATISLPITRGQKTLDPKLLPLSCLTITTDGTTLPLEKLIIENTKTKKNYTAIFKKSFGLLTASQAGEKSHSLAIMELPAGHYRILELVFLFQKYGRDIDLVFAFGKTRNFNFKVNPGAVNYHGSMVISADWKAPGVWVSWVEIGPWGGWIPGWGAQSKLNSKVELEDTLVRDVKWATGVVPGMTNLPMVNSPLASN
jgi:hypothetical protein